MKKFLWALCAVLLVLELPPEEPVVPFSALALGSVPVDLPPRKNLGDLEEELFS